MPHAQPQEQRQILRLRDVGGSKRHASRSEGSTQQFVGDICVDVLRVGITWEQQLSKGSGCSVGRSGDELRVPGTVRYRSPNLSGASGRRACSRSGVKTWSHRSASSMSKSEAPSCRSDWFSKGRRRSATLADTTACFAANDARSAISPNAPQMFGSSSPSLATSIRRPGLNAGSRSGKGGGRSEGTTASGAHPDGEASFRTVQTKEDISPQLIARVDPGREHLPKCCQESGHVILCRQSDQRRVGSVEKRVMELDEASAQSLPEEVHDATCHIVVQGNVRSSGIELERPVDGISATPAFACWRHVPEKRQVGGKGCRLPFPQAHCQRRRTRFQCPPCQRGESVGRATVRVQIPRRSPRRATTPPRHPGAVDRTC